VAISVMARKRSISRVVRERLKRSPASLRICSHVFGYRRIDPEHRIVTDWIAVWILHRVPSAVYHDIEKALTLRKKIEGILN
jgi:hypothetical protein